VFCVCLRVYVFVWVECVCMVSACVLCARTRARACVPFLEQHVLEEDEAEVEEAIVPDASPQNRLV
jgi:hypothetical protein